MGSMQTRRLSVEGQQASTLTLSHTPLSRLSGAIPGRRRQQRRRIVNRMSSRVLPLTFPKWDPVRIIIAPHAPLLLYAVRRPIHEHRPCPILHGTVFGERVRDALYDACQPGSTGPTSRSAPRARGAGVRGGEGFICLEDRFRYPLRHD
jgi:hypothetical protein